MIERRRVLAPEGGRLMTKQAERDASDVNKIVARWRQSGVMPQGSNRQPRYGDFSSGASFHDNLNSVREAERNFMDLPSKIRSYCGNDPGEYLDLCLDPERREECEELGIKEAQLPEKALLVRLEEAAKPPIFEKPQE